MKLVGRVALGVLALLLLAVAVGSLLPRQWRVERSVVIAAPPERIHPFLDDLRRWPEWAAWNKEMDSKVVWTYGGPDRGVGARWAWNGPVMGKGRMEIVASDPVKGLRIDEAIESETVNAHARFDFAPEGAGTKVTWIDEGTLPPVVGGFFRGMIEDMLNQHFSTGLAKLKAAVEALPPPAPPAPEPKADAATADADGGAPPEADAGAP
ncbi:MAG: SRPBCC family protein [Myxococcota bacterium]|jgi:carbon monoxide dehydrogenase subunit G